MKKASNFFIGILIVSYVDIDLLQVSLEEIQDQIRIVWMNSDSDVWPKIAH